MIDWINNNGRAIQIIYFTGLFFIVWILSTITFQKSFFNDVLIIYVVLNFLIVWCNYYILTKVFFGIKSPIKWVVLIFSLVLLYFSSHLALTYPLKFMHLRYPDHEVLKYFYEGLYIRSFVELFTLRVPSWLSGRLYLPLCLFFAGSLVFRYIESLKKVTDLELSNAYQEMDLLKSQIQPQFLLSTLNSLYLLTKDNGKASEVVSKLSDLLKFTLYDSNEALIPLKIELSFLQDFIELEKIRHHDHVKIEYDFSAIQNEESKIAPLLFINFIENAFKHGVNKTRGSSWVKIVLIQKSGIVEFVVSNSKPRKALHDAAGGKGLENITRRLQLLYPDKHQLIIDNRDEVYSVHLKIELT